MIIKKCNEKFLITSVIKKNGKTEPFNIKKMCKSLKTVFDKCGTLGNDFYVEVLCKAIIMNYQESEGSSDILHSNDIRTLITDFLNNCDYIDEANYYNKYKNFSVM